MKTYRCGGKANSQKQNIWKGLSSIVAAKKAEREIKLIKHDASNEGKVDNLVKHSFAAALVASSASIAREYCVAHPGNPVAESLGIAAAFVESGSLLYAVATAKQATEYCKYSPQLMALCNGFKNTSDHMNDAVKNKILPFVKKASSKIGQALNGDKPVLNKLMQSRKANSQG